MGLKGVKLFSWKFRGIRDVGWFVICAFNFEGFWIKISLLLDESLNFAFGEVSINIVNMPPFHPQYCFTVHRLPTPRNVVVLRADLPEKCTNRKRLPVFSRDIHCSFACLTGDPCINFSRKRWNYGTTRLSPGNSPFPRRQSKRLL